MQSLLLALLFLFVLLVLLRIGTGYGAYRSLEPLQVILYLLICNRYPKVGSRIGLIEILEELLEIGKHIPNPIENVYIVVAAVLVLLVALFVVDLPHCLSFGGVETLFILVRVLKGTLLPRPFDHLGLGFRFIGAVDALIAFILLFDNLSVFEAVFHFAGNVVLNRPKVYPTVAAVATDPNQIVILVGGVVIVDLLAELAELAVGVFGVAWLAECAVLAGFDLGLDPLVQVSGSALVVEAHLLLLLAALGRTLAGHRVVLVLLFWVVAVFVERVPGAIWASAAVLLLAFYDVVWLQGDCQGRLGSKQEGLAGIWESSSTTAAAARPQQLYTHWSWCSGRRTASWLCGAPNRGLPTSTGAKQQADPWSCPDEILL